ncbi:hypothetical protein [uncultured Anaerofustis sp.]|uniref:hypothetical protein n=1 Tax=uncultured Anaerofustis sp. TaxID=904996 RepID=UPI0025E0DD6B|nr:hypothetical protein [uncultured Anaerofustis sp.]
MSMTNVESVKIIKNQVSGYPTFTAIGEEGVLVDYSSADDKTLLILSASADSTVSVHAGNGIQGAEDNQFSFEIKNGETKTLVLESGMFMDVKENKGKVKITATGTVSIGAIVLP